MFSSDHLDDADEDGDDNEGVLSCLAETDQLQFGLYPILNPPSLTPLLSFNPLNDNRPKVSNIIPILLGQLRELLLLLFTFESNLTNIRFYQMKNLDL